MLTSYIAILVVTLASLAWVLTIYNKPFLALLPGATAIVGAIILLRLLFGGPIEL